MLLRLNIPPLTRLSLILLLVLSFLTAALRYVRWVRGGVLASAMAPAYLVLVPQRSWLYPWVVLTATLVEQNVFGLLVSAATLFYGGRYLERAWGTSELAKFLLVVALVSNGGAWVIDLARLALTADVGPSVKEISGAVALQGAFLVAFKQLVPEHTVTIARGVLTVRVKHFPAVFLVWHTLAGIVLGMERALVLAWLGFLASWTYLRFYKVSPDLSSSATGGSAGIRGDPSETFAFAGFFPDPLSTPIAAVADRIYHVLVAVKICTPFSAEDVEMGNVNAMAREEAGLPSLNGPTGGRSGVRGGGKREEAERRRALALKALDQRLHAASNRVQSAAAAATGPSRTPEANVASDSPNAGAGKADEAP